MATRLGDMAVGSTVKIKVNGTLTDFLIVQQGSPGSGDNDFDGTWVLMTNIIKQMRFSPNSNLMRFSDSDVIDYLNGEFLTSLVPGISKEIKQVSVRDASNYEGTHYVSCKVFVLSASEVGIPTNSNGIENIYPLSYFKGLTSTDEDYPKRVAYYEGSKSKWWLRDYSRFSGTLAVYESGSLSMIWPDTYRVGVRPAFILNSNLWVSSNGMVVTLPGITTDTTDLGEQNAPFTVAYTATDTGTGTLTVTEKLDGEVKQTRTEVSPGTALTVDWLKEKADYQQVLNGAHTITLEVDNGIMSATKTITFTKNVTGAQVSLTAPLTADDTITVAALTLEGSFPTDLSLTVEMTNNALDDSPVWENCTDIQRGEAKAFVHHAFTNKTAARGFAFNYKVTIARGASGVGGNITMIGGVIG